MDNRADRHQHDAIADVRKVVGTDVGKQQTMRKTPVMSCLLVDIGDVLLTDGWDRLSRQSGAEHFSLDVAEIEDGHSKRPVV